MSFPKTLNVPDKSSLLVPQTTKASATGPTTAVSYETASLEIRSIRGSPYLPSSPVDSQQFDGRSIISTSGMSEYIADLNDLPSIRHDINPTSIKTGGTGSRSFKFLNCFQTLDSELSNMDFFTKYISILKGDDKAQFNNKLKHFFIFSSAGKPIYSMNGSDDIVIGYMGILTTIVSSFQENFNQELQVLELGQGLKIVAVNKSPIILISISKLLFETVESVHLQLDTLYCYLIGILSKSVIDKHFNNRLNYDLRRILSPLDFENLDELCLDLTYGIPNTSDRTQDSTFGLYTSQVLLPLSRESVKIRHTLRSKLNSIVNTNNEDVLFTILLSGNGKILNYLHPKQHNLPNKDLNMLLFIIHSLLKNQSQQDEDLWLPLCMPTFNDHGFLYVFVRQWQDLVLMLISGSKNSFDALKLSANEICTKLNNKQELAVKLINELSIPLSIEVPFVFKHFIYKDIRLNQFVMSELPTHEFSSFQFLKCYNELKVSQAKIIKHDNNLNYKKLTYLQDRDITGFMLMDKYYEFYCIIERSSEQETITSKKLIQISSQIIRWCKKNHARLFVTI